MGPVYIDILFVLLIIGCAFVAIRKGVQHKDGASYYLAAAILLSVLLAVSIQSFEILGMKVQIRGARTQDVEFAIQTLGTDVSAEDLSVFLVPEGHQGQPLASGEGAKYSFEDIPVGIYTVLVADPRDKGVLSEGRNVERAAIEPAKIQPIERFPVEASVQGTIKSLGGESGSKRPVVIREQFAWTDDQGRFEISGLDPGGQYTLQVLGDEISSTDLELSSHDLVFDDAIYAPTPVETARICDAIEIPENRFQLDGWRCADQIGDRYPADVRKLWFLTQIRATPPTEVVHRWTWGEDVEDIPLVVESSNYRTYCSREIAGKTGRWTVDVLGPDKEQVLATKFFHVGAQ